ncbi:MAG: CHAT domain-containing protein [Leptolyngbyaceae cyanobacterium CSU_1_3]|nr:CHAT domain-containing protein [Leptolyngbyaceae cyanobacterium CSU_1_3]
MAIVILLCVTPGLIQPATASLSSALSLDQQAQTHYSDRQFTEAATQFQQAAQAYKNAGDRVRQALSLSNLSLAYQQLGQWNQASQAIDESLSILQTSPANTPRRAIALAQSFDILGGLKLARGQSEAALKAWEQAATLYQQAGKRDRALTSQTNQAQAFQNLGLYRRAIALLDTALDLPTRATATPKQLTTQLQSVPVSAETATALQALGESLRVIGNLPQATLVLQRSLAIATHLQLPDTIALSQLSLGNTARASGDRSVALQFYEQAATAPTTLLSIQAQVNQLSLWVNDQPEKAQSLLPTLQSQISALPPSRVEIDARINLAQTIMQLKGADPKPIAQLLAVAVQHAQDLGDPRTQSYAVGSLGSLYEQTQQWSDAEKLTQQALQLAQPINAGDIAYRWQWQLGRVLKAQGKTEGAIAAYQEAVASIKSLRADLAAASPDVQFSFRDAVEPIHRQLVELLLTSIQVDRLKTARSVLEDLQLVELDNFFREACLNANPQQIDQVDQRAAIIYPIVLEDQLALIVSLPSSNGSSSLRYYKTAIDRAQVEAIATRLREDIDQPTTQKLTLPKLQKMYDLLIRPEAADLAASKVETLVFILDGALRSVPMSALHDGQAFLIEQYSIALAPGLQLLSPRSLRPDRLGVLVAGLTEARPPGFSALPSVKDEVNKIQSEMPSQLLFNQKFTSSAFQTTIAAAPYPIVHLATHGQFGSQASDTFILTWDGKIKVNQLSSILKTIELSRRNGSLELLVLSACETAAGDARSALGLAGVAVRSGARSTIATLWRVNDTSSATLMGQFYDELSQTPKTGISKAEALRRAQLKVLRDPDYSSPYFWSAYVLIGNWI